MRTTLHRYRFVIATVLAVAVILVGILIEPSDPEDVTPTNLVLNADELPEGYVVNSEAAEPRNLRALQAASRLTDEMTVTPPHCVPRPLIPEGVYGSDIGVVFAGEGARRLMVAVVPTQEDIDAYRASITDACATTEMTSTRIPDTSVVSTFTELDAPASRAEDAVVFRQESITNSRQVSEANISLAGVGTVSGYTVTVSATSDTGTEPDRAALDAAFVAALDKVYETAPRT